MNFVRHSVAALASACLLTACGGGGIDPPAPRNQTESTAQAADTPTQIELEGCTVDPHGQPHATRVHALSEDGRLIATAISSPQGVFHLTVPARTHLSLALDTPGTAPLALLTGSTRLSLSGCLSDSAA